MGGLRGKLLVTLVVYFAGFASAIYYQAPALDESEMQERQVPEGKGVSVNEVTTNGEILAAKAHTELLKFRSFAEEKASQVGALVKQRLDGH